MRIRFVFTDMTWTVTQAVGPRQILLLLLGISMIAVGVAGLTGLI